MDISCLGQGYELSDDAWPPKYKLFWTHCRCLLFILTSSYIPARFRVLPVHPVTSDNAAPLSFGVMGFVLPSCSLAFPIGSHRRTFFWGVSFCSLVLCCPLLGTKSQSPSLGLTEALALSTDHLPRCSTLPTFLPSFSYSARMY